MSLLDRRLRRTVRRSGLPNLPEVRRWARLSYWDGFIGVPQRRLEDAYVAAVDAVSRDVAERANAYRRASGRTGQ